jgi:group I intron endonuclease
MSYGIIYKATFPNGKVYIGQTIKPIHLRIRVHGSCKKKTRFNSAIKKYGFDNIAWETIDTAENKEELDRKEIGYINLYNSRGKKYGYNIALGGSSGKPGLGKKKSEEEKRRTGAKNSVNMKRLWATPEYRERQLKAFEAFKDRPPPKKGKHLSEETKQKLREINTGKIYGEETRRKVSEASKRMWQNPEFRKKIADRPVSEETRKKLSVAFKGRKSPSRKLSDNDVLEIREHLKQEISIQEIAAMFNVTWATIYHIKTGRFYKWVKQPA